MLSKKLWKDNVSKELRNVSGYLKSLKTIMLSKQLTMIMLYI